MDAALLHPSRFLHSQEFKGKDVTLTITKIDLEELEDENQKKKMKGVISFGESPKLLVINRTNSDCLKGMFGRETDAWVGKRITFYPAPFFNNFTKEHTTCIRVRGSPDLKEATTVTVALPRKKAVQVKMAKTSAAASAAPVLAGDELQVELDAISALISAAEPTPAACDALWSAGLGKRIAGLPPPEKAVKTEEFKARKRGQPAAPPPASDPPPGDAPPPDAPPPT